MTDANPHWIYTQTIRMFAAPASPPFEDEAELERHWGRAFGIDNDVGRIQSILVHRPRSRIDDRRPEEAHPTAATGGLMATSETWLLIVRHRGRGNPWLAEQPICPEQDRGAQLLVLVAR
jgi:hypothetical protein